MNIKISDFVLSSWNGFYATVEMNNGKRYGAYYTVKPTTEEVKEDFNNNKNSFNHIN